MFNLSDFIIPETPLSIGLTGYSEYHNHLQEIFSSFQEFSLVKFKSSSIEESDSESKSSKTTSKSLNIVSKKWVANYLATPVCNVHIADITNSINNNQSSENIAKIIEDEVAALRKKYNKSQFLLLIFNLSSTAGTSTAVKARLKSTPNNIFNDQNVFLYFSKQFKATNANIFGPFKNALQTKLKQYFMDRTAKYKIQIQKNSQNTKNPELLGKYLIKESYILNANKDEKKKADNLLRAYNIFSKKINKNTYMFITSKDTYLFYYQIRNVCDYIMVNMLESKKLRKGDVLNKINGHFAIFDCFNYFKDKPELITPEIELLNIIWIYSWYEHIIQNKEEVRKSYDFFLDQMHILLRLVNYIEQHNETVLKITRDNSLYTIIENSEIGKMPVFSKEDKSEIKEDELLLLYISHEIKTSFTNFDYFRNKLVEKIKFIISDFEISKQSVADYNTLLLYVFTLVNDKKKIFTKEEEKNFLHIIIYSKHILLKKYPLIHIHLINKYTELILAEPIDELSSFDQKDLINNLLQILTYRELEPKEQKLLNKLFTLNNNSDKIDISADSILTITSEFDCKQIKRFSAVNFTVNINLNIDFLTFNEIDKISLLFSNYKKNHAYTGSNLSLTKDKPLSFTLNLLTTENDGKYLELEEVHIILQNGITIIKTINRDSSSNLPLLITDNTRIEEVKLIYDKGTINVATKEYHVYTFEIERNESPIETAISSITGDFGVFRKDGDDTQQKFFQFIYKYPETKKFKAFHDNLSININKPDNNKNTLMFILQITEEGTFLLNFNINITVSFLQFEKFSDINTRIIKKNGIIQIQTIKPLKVESLIKSNIFITEVNENSEHPKSILYPIGHPLYVNYNLINNLPYDIYISKLLITPSEYNLTIESKLMKLIEKGKNNILKKDCYYNIPFILTCNEAFNDSPGFFMINWQTEKLKQYTNDKLFNSISCNFTEIATDRLMVNVSTLIKENELLISLVNRSSYLLPLLFKIKDNDEQIDKSNDIIVLGKKVQRLNIYPDNTIELKMKVEKMYKERKNKMIKLPNIDVELLIAFNNKEEDDELQYKPIFIVHFNNMYHSSG